MRNDINKLRREVEAIRPGGPSAKIAYEDPSGVLRDEDGQVLNREDLDSSPYHWIIYDELYRDL